MAKLEEIRLRGPAPLRAEPEARFPALVGVGADAVERMRRTRIGVIGVGSVGGLIAAHLARLAPALLLVVDRSRYKPESVLTDAACAGPSESGRPKASAAARRAKKVSPSTRVLAFDGPFEDLPAPDLFELGLDTLFLCGDNLALEVSVGQTCLEFGIPLTHAAVHGETLSAHCRVYAMADPAAGSCPACGLSEKGEWDLVGRDAVFSCAPETRAVRHPSPDRPPTASFSFLCSTAADLAVGLWVRRTLGIGSEPGDFCLEWSGYRLESTLTPLERNPECRCDHTRLVAARVVGPLSLASAGSMAAAAGVGLAGGTINLPGYAFVRIGSCACSEERPVGRFVGLASSLPPCRGCGERVRPHPFFSTEVVPGEWLDPHRDVSLKALGAPGARAAVIRLNGHAAFVTGGDDEAD